MKHVCGRTEMSTAFWKGGGGGGVIWKKEAN